MDVLKQEDFLHLIEIADEWCVSFYMPTYKVGLEQQQNAIEYKRLLSRAEEKLLEYGLRRPEVEAGMRTAQNLLLDQGFWQHPGDGLAVFLSPGSSRMFRLPFQFDELMVIGKVFHIKPLLPLLNEDGQFYILAISLNEIRLLLGTRYTVSQVELVNVPTSMQEALFMDDPEKHLSLHTSTTNPGASGKRPAIFHGQGDPSGERKKNILRYFQYVDEGLSAILGRESFPMVLAGVGYLLPMYHEANTYTHLLKFGLEGNPDGLDARDLHQRAWKLVEPIFGENREKARKQFEQLHGQQSRLATSDLRTAVEAAKAGSVETLFVPLEIQRWGRFEPQENKVVLDQEPSLENEDLLDFAAIHTILNSGQVFAVKSELLPGNGDLAAIFRYAHWSPDIDIPGEEYT